jgi:transposase-like protein
MKMAKDPDRKSEPEDHDEQAAAEAAEEAEVEAAASAHPPTCPQCGWHNTRLSHTRNALDSILRLLSLRAFRCRACGNRFRVRYSSKA